MSRQRPLSRAAVLGVSLALHVSLGLGFVLAVSRPTPVPDDAPAVQMVFGVVTADASNALPGAADAGTVPAAVAPPTELPERVARETAEPDAPQPLDPPPAMQPSSMPGTAMPGTAMPGTAMPPTALTAPELASRAELPGRRQDEPPAPRDTAAPGLPPAVPPEVPTPPAVKGEHPSASRFPASSSPAKPVTASIPASPLSARPGRAPLQPPQRLRHGPASIAAPAVPASEATTGSSPGPLGNPPVAPAVPAPASPPAMVDGAWRGALSAWVQSRKHYPEEARRQGIEGQVVIRFTIGRDGAVLAAEIVRGSGSELLDLATQAIFVGARGPAFPSGMAQAQLTSTVAIRYRLSD